MALARWQATLTDEHGNIIPGPEGEYEVRREDTGALPQLYANREGTVTKGNPFAVDADGFGFLYVGGGSYKITPLRDGIAGTPWRHVAIGLAGESDGAASVTLPEFTAAGDLTVAAGDRGYRIARDTPETADIILPTEASRGGLPLTIADGDGSFEANPQTIIFAGSDTARGETTLVLNSNWQTVTLYPQGDGTWMIG